MVANKTTRRIPIAVDELADIRKAEGSRESRESVGERNLGLIKAEIVRKRQNENAEHVRLARPAREIADHGDDRP